MIEHYLITIPVGPHQHMHCYLMTDDKRCCVEAADRMIKVIEDCGATPWPNIVLQTTLGDGVKIVHACLRELFKDAWETQQRAKNYHVTIFAMTTDDPWDAKLMELH